MDCPLGVCDGRSAMGDVVVGFCDNHVGDEEGAGGDVGVQTPMHTLVAARDAPSRLSRLPCSTSTTHQKTHTWTKELLACMFISCPDSPILDVDDTG